LASFTFNEKFRRPTIGFIEVLRKGAGGLYRERDQYVPFMFRALVIAVDNIGGKLETPDGTAEGGNLEQHVVVPGKGDVGSYQIEPTRGPRNPKGSLKARVLSSNLDQFVDDDSLRTYWPLFPGLHNPDAGELVYVVFEDEEMLHGLWIASVPTSDPNETANQVLMSQLLQDVASSKKSLYDLTGAASPGAGNIPIKQPHRLTNLYLDTGKR
jgi:hypothetical protein